MVLIGCGRVGESFLYATINSSVDKYIKDYFVIDPNEKFLKGVLLDLNDAYALSHHVNNRIKSGTYQDVNDADIVFITAGRAQHPHETRTEMLSDNITIIKSIAQQINKTNFQGLIIIASNPVDILTTVFSLESNLPTPKIMGSGTYLDTMRLKQILTQTLTNISIKDINGYVIGEHGENMVVD